MPQRKNQHYVPKFFFRRFSLDGRSISVLNKVDGRVVPTASIKTRASKDWFYGKSGVEDDLCEAEGVCGDVLRRLAAERSPRRLDPDHYSDLLAWLCLQHSRTEAARHASYPMFETLSRLYADIGAEIDGSCADGNPLSDEVGAHVLQMEAAVSAAQSIGDLRPLFLENRTTRPFIFGDAPVVFHNLYYGKVKLRGVLGYRTPGLLISYPLGPRLSLMLVDDAAYKVRRATEDRVLVKDLNDVAALNKLQIHAALRCVYFESNQFSDYVKHLWQQEKGVLAHPAGTVNWGTCVVGNGKESLGEVVHFFQPLLSYKPRLSFLNHDVLDDAQFRNHVRG